MRSNRIPRTVDPRGPSQVRKTRGAVFPRKLSVRFRRSRETVVEKMERSGPTAARLNWFLSISNCRTSGGLRPLQETGGAQRQRGVRRFDGDTPCRTRNRHPESTMPPGDETTGPAVNAARTATPTTAPTAGSVTSGTISAREPQGVRDGLLGTEFRRHSHQKPGQKVFTGYTLLINE